MAVSHGVDYGDDSLGVLFSFHGVLRFRKLSRVADDVYGAGVVRRPWLWVPSSSSFGFCRFTLWDYPCFSMVLPFSWCLLAFMVVCLGVF